MRRSFANAIDRCACVQGPRLFAYDGGISVPSSTNKTRPAVLRKVTTARTLRIGKNLEIPCQTRHSWTNRCYLVRSSLHEHTILFSMCRVLGRELSQARLKLYAPWLSRHVSILDSLKISCYHNIFQFTSYRKRHNLSLLRFRSRLQGESVIATSQHSHVGSTSIIII